MRQRDEPAARRENGRVDTRNTQIRVSRRRKHDDDDARSDCATCTDCLVSIIVHVEKFVDQHELLAQARGLTLQQLRASHALHDDDSTRWIAVAGGKGCGEASASRGPDLKTRVRLDCRDAAARAPLARAVAADLSGTLYATVDGSEVVMRSAFTAAGFVVEYTDDVYQAEFARVPSLRASTNVRGFSFMTADRAHTRSWFTLDNTLRQDVRGLDGWRGDLKWFAEENQQSPHFDPAAYVIAVDDANGEYAGLCRFWNGPDGKVRLGMLGVLRQYRGLGLGAALLVAAAGPASRWGSPTFTGETYRGAEAMCALWKSLGAAVVGSKLTLVRRAS